MTGATITGATLTGKTLTEVIHTGSTQATGAVQSVAATALPQSAFNLESIIPASYLGPLQPILKYEIFGNSVLQILIGLGIVLLSYLILPFIWRKYLKPLAHSFESFILNFNNKSTGAETSKMELSGKIFGLLAVYLGLNFLNIPENIVSIIKGFLVALVSVQVALFLQPLLESLIRNMPLLNKPDMKAITNRLVVFTKGALWAIVGIFSLSALGVNTGPILGSLGVLGVGGALAFQQMVPGFVKTISFHFSKPFSVGDKISAGTHQGIVEEIDISTTKLKKASGEFVDVKNEELMTAIVLPADGPHRASESIKLNLDIKNEAPIFTEIETILKNVIKNVADTTFEKMHFTDFKGTGVQLEFSYSVLVEKKVSAKHDIIQGLIQEFKAKNIVFTGV